MDHRMSVIIESDFFNQVNLKKRITLYSEVLIACSNIHLISRSIPISSLTMS